ncbi:hypothetical protein BU24DRAFT_483527 [Aaosphaeria arxii CBS 175.79]|uniref:Uncharacterized protein n=1 Tax=Aaosphaeria arxii CBS 175.79 TaxID=1450172 RepID=A0A6A5XKE1_9PLEO|nr:uncharacterized protein BU24DRAFT_483527 [Aaosphaeria arxii CBS 175.79]KAF2013725.1 hypothetical protein BU24DRAFT_483527 [Aaosphaeria arxii CBS 175.79]
MEHLLWYVLGRVPESRSHMIVLARLDHTPHEHRAVRTAPVRFVTAFGRLSAVCVAQGFPSRAGRDVEGERFHFIAQSQRFVISVDDGTVHEASKFHTRFLGGGNIGDGGESGEKESGWERRHLVVYVYVSMNDLKMDQANAMEKEWKKRNEKRNVMSWKDCGQYWERYTLSLRTFTPFN